MAEALAELIIAEELKLGRWQEADLKTRPKGDSVKVALAARLRAETTMTVGWIAERLAMGTRGYLNHLLYRRRKLKRGQFLILSTPRPAPSPVQEMVRITGCAHCRTFGDPPPSWSSPPAEIQEIRQSRLLTQPIVHRLPPRHPGIDQKKGSAEKEKGSVLDIVNSSPSTFAGAGDGSDNRV
jgi:hypothetical protein